MNKYVTDDAKACYKHCLSMLQMVYLLRYNVVVSCYRASAGAGKAFLCDAWNMYRKKVFTEWWKFTKRGVIKKKIYKGLVQKKVWPKKRST